MSLSCHWQGVSFLSQILCVVFVGDMELDLLKKVKELERGDH